jgi:hypothetical protein
MLCMLNYVQLNLKLLDSMVYIPTNHLCVELIIFWCVVSTYNLKANTNKNLWLGLAKAEISQSHFIHFYPRSRLPFKSYHNRSNIKQHVKFLPLVSPHGISTAIQMWHFTYHNFKFLPNNSTPTPWNHGPHKKGHSYLFMLVERPSPLNLWNEKIHYTWHHRSRFIVETSLSLNTCLNISSLFSAFCSVCVCVHY